MIPSPLVVRVDLNRIRANVSEIARACGVDVLGVVKADAYGLGAAHVAAAIAPLVAGFCVFALAEAVVANLKSLGKPTLVLGPPLGDAGAAIAADDYRAHQARPAVTSEAQAAALRSASPVVCVDTGMQRFACPIENVERVMRAGGCREAFTHATRIEQVEQLSNLLGGGRGIKLHAAGSALLENPRAMLDAVRPGLAMYRSAIRITSTLVEAHESRGPAGYSGFRALRHGVILGGYAHGVRTGAPCVVNGTRRRILEAGMQSSYVEIGGPNDRAGDEVVLLDGLELPPEELAAHADTSPHEVLVRLASTGRKVYAG